MAVRADQKIAWRPFAGSQVAFLSAPYEEVLFHGTRGGGKTDCLIFDFARGVNQGFGSNWRGILFRRTFPELEDVITKTKRWFSEIWPEAKFNEAKTQWTFPDGEMLLLRAFDKPDDYYKYHGHAFTWIAFEELTTWPTDEGYLRMMSCLRSTVPGIPKRMRATTNPSGIGHSWVKRRFRLGGQNHLVKVIKDSYDRDGNIEPPRAAIYGSMFENRALMDSDSGYIARIKQSAKNEAERKAWLEGSWDIISGGMFTEAWESSVHCVQPFEIPPTWKIDRCFDWGSSRPYAVCWFAESDGSDITFDDGRVKSTLKGDVFLIGELYGWDGETPNVGTYRLATEVSADIIQFEKDRGWKVRPGCADSAIFATENGRSIAADMAKPIVLRDGATTNGAAFIPADKRPGSRKAGWETVRTYLANAIPPKDSAGNVLPREKPGLFVIEEYCPNFVRTVPVLPRDKRDLDDLDTNSEDHLADCVRYRLRSPNGKVASGKTVGLM